VDLSSRRGFTEREFLPTHRVLGGFKLISSLQMTPPGVETILNYVFLAQRLQYFSPPLLPVFKAIIAKIPCGTRSILSLSENRKKKN
jgi:hypothetical protein